MSNIHPIFERMLQRTEREQHLRQRSRVVWLTGLSGSGKSTIAIALERRLHEDGYFAQVLDGDNIRAGINSNLGFSLEDRRENIRRIAEIAKLYAQTGIVTINCFISPTEEIRQMARDIIGEADFLEIYINTPLEICEQRDPKGLYKKARRGEIADFSGITSPYEAPANPAFEVLNEGKTIEESTDEVYQFLLKKIAYRED